MNILWIICGLLFIGYVILFAMKALYYLALFLIWVYNALTGTNEESEPIKDPSETQSDESAPF